MNEIEIAVPPQRVFAVLADPFAYAEWVLGAKAIRGADPGFPRKGTRFYHSIGVGPFVIKHHSRVLEVEADRRLVLDARLRALGSAIVTLQLQPSGAGTRVVMTERAGDGLPARVMHKAGNLVLRGRNFLSLEKLKDVAEQRG